MRTRITRDTGIRREQISRETDKAVCVMIFIDANKTNDGARAVWFPKSQIDWAGEEMGFADTMHVPVWLLKAKDWPFRARVW